VSVSYVVPVWREDVYERTAKPWVMDQCERFGAELIEARGSKSIFEAQETGRRKARHGFICYVHDDVRLLKPLDLTPHIAEAFERFPKLGLIGPVGKIQRSRVPWWTNPGNYVGHWCRRGNRNQLVYQQAGTQSNAPFRDVIGDPAKDLRLPRWDRFAHAGLVDGFFLVEQASRLNLPWDTQTFGEQWHGYDIDRCFQAHSLGLDVMVPPWLFLHDNAGHAGYKGTDPTRIHGKDQANRQVNSEGDRLWLSDLDVVNGMLRKKWGLA
jgi:hypothetical protein